MPSVTVSLPSPFGDWVQEKVQSGEFASAGEYLAELVRYDRERPAHSLRDEEYVLSAKEEQDIRLALEEVARGEIASDAEVAEMYKRFPGMKVLYSRRAFVQERQILQRLAAESASAAAMLAKRIEAIVSLLSRRPDIGRRTRVENVRAFRTSPYPYLIFYSSDLEADVLTILSFRHTSRAGDWREGR